MSLAGIAKANQTIVDEGRYSAPSGRVVDVADAVAAAVRDTRLYRPDELAALVARDPLPGAPARPVVEVVEAKTGEAARRLACETGDVPTLLNFASARNPGGGYLRGAKAQEEDLARCSALYHTQLSQRAYYDANRGTQSLIYTDHIIHSPSVPFFRDEHYALLDAPVRLSVITAPAPNAGEVLRRNPGAASEIEQALRRRAAMVLAVAEDHGARNLVLGAWGCGVFRNDPALVADAFATWLAHPRFAPSFDRIVFAIYDRTPGQRNLAAFRALAR